MKIRINKFTTKYAGDRILIIVEGGPGDEEKFLEMVRKTGESDVTGHVMGILKQGILAGRIDVLIGSSYKLIPFVGPFRSMKQAEEFKTLLHPKRNKNKPHW